MQAQHSSTPTSTPGQKQEQKFPPQTHLYQVLRMSTVYLNWSGKTQLVVVPHQRAFKLTEMYAVDLQYLFQEIYHLMEQKRVHTFSLHVFKRDWNVAPHLFLKVGMPQAAYQQFVTGSHPLGQVRAIPEPEPAEPDATDYVVLAQGSE